MTQRGPVATSAPGKVLFAGGFLVLDRRHTGLVFGLDARIYVRVEGFSSEHDGTAEREMGTKNGGGSGNVKKVVVVVVESPQFGDARWVYVVATGHDAEGKAVEVRQEGGGENEGTTRTRNKFVETAVRYALTYLEHVRRGVRESVRVTVLADDDYYSQAGRGRGGEEAKGKQGRFTDFGVKLGEAHKTGLGSSAALTTALVASLVAYFTESAELPLEQIHNLAQAAHCAAQGKVGSGFDVAAAVYGSCLYRRFTPAILESVGEPDSDGFGERLHRCVEDLEYEQKWDVEVASQAVKVPEGLSLVMCDVDCGSETPGMVRKVLQWRKDNAEEAELLWTALQKGTEELSMEMTRLAEVGGVDHDYKELGDIILTIRSFVRDMSEKSKVPIEPPVITELLDYCTSLPGVVGGVAPGAGGYDAVALLVRNDEGVMNVLGRNLTGWKSKEESGATIGNVRLLGVKQDQEGLRLEDPALYQGWIP